MLVVLTLLAALGAQSEPDGPPPAVAARRLGELLVQYRSQPPLWALGDVAPVRPHVALVHFDEAQHTLTQARARLVADPQVQHVEPNLLLWTQRDWARRDVRAAQGKLGELWRRAGPLKAPALRAVHIGVLDTGIDGAHPDLIGSIGAGVNLLTPPGHGAEAADISPMDYNGHGTLVAGIMAARHNAFGIDGINDDAELLPIKVFDQDGVGSLADVLQGIEWARRRRVDILNMSFGTYEPSALLAQALQQAQAEGMLLVAAAGNDGAGAVVYPAALPEVLAVGSAGDGGISRFSNFGPGVDYYAPGEGLLSTTSGALGPHGYGPVSGTSAAAAHLSGVLSLALQSGVAAERVAAYCAARSPWRQSTRAVGTPTFRLLGSARILSDLMGQALTELTVTHWHVAPQGGRGPVQVAVDLHNTGNSPWPAGQLELDLRGESLHRRLPLGRAPDLAPGGTFTQAFTVDLPRDLEPTLQEGGRLSLRATLRQSGDALEAEPLDLRLTATPAPHLSVRNMWLTPFNRALTSTPVVHLRLHNDGEVMLPPQRLSVAAMAAVHEGIWDVPSVPLTDAHTVPALDPGAWLDVALPASEPLPATAEFTLLAELRPAALDAQASATVRAIQAFSTAAAGQAKVLYNQAAHMASVETAVELLRLQNIVIPDIHSDDAPFKGSAATARDFGGAISIGTSSWRWRWDIDWPRYPWTAKNLVDGASACDGIDVAYGDGGIHTWDTHFWVVDEGDAVGLGNHSALAKIRALLLGDPNSAIKDGAIAAYRAGEPARAWWLVGHAAHLLGDLSTGAHTLNRNWHGVVGDPYHDWVGQEGHYRAWPATAALAAGGVLEVYRSDLLSVDERLRFLAYTTAQVGSSFPWHRRRGWLPNKGASFGDGNRHLGGDWPHYGGYLRPLFANVVQHPSTVRDLISDEVYSSAKRCEAVPHPRIGDTLQDCWDGGDGHIDRNNILTGDLDGDLSRIADVSYNHAVRAIAALIALFARETGQI